MTLSNPKASFFKTHFKIWFWVNLGVIIFLVLGASVDNVNAGWPGECSYLQAKFCYGVGNTKVFTINVNPADGDIYFTNGTFGLDGRKCNFFTYYFENGSWKTADSYLEIWCELNSFNENVDVISNLNPENLYGNACPQCVDEKAAKAIECGGEENIINWDNATCTGDCTPPCEIERAAKVIECGGDEYVDWTSWDDVTCSGANCRAVPELNHGPPPECTEPLEEFR